MHDVASPERQEAQLCPSGSQSHFFKKRRAWQKIAIFIILLSLFSGSLAIARLFVPNGTRLVLLTWSSSLADMFGMWSVGIAGLVALVLIDRSVGGVGFRLPPAKFMILGCAVPIVYCAAIYLPVWLFTPWAFAGTSALAAGIVSSLIHLPRAIFAAAGEELGWRGVLVPNLALVASPALVSVAPGALWAVWHYPDILFFGYGGGRPSLFALTCFSMGLVGTGAFLSWIRLSSGSVWPAILFHGVHNSVIWGVFERATNKGGISVYVTTEFGAGFALVGTVLSYAAIRYGMIRKQRARMTVHLHHAGKIGLRRHLRGP
jgi:membrane protease YdiL (CAAX protease family)